MNLTTTDWTNFVEECKKEFPDLKIKFKDQSVFMKFLSFLLFFNRSFMTNYITTIGSNVYFPSQEFINKNVKGNIVVLLNELVHIYDANKYSKVLFSLLYLSPQILALLALPLSFVSLWFLLLLLLAAPIPAFFRMYFEKKAYSYSLYCNAYFDQKQFGTQVLPEFLKTYYIPSYVKQFKTSYYYFMWPFNDVQKYFYELSDKICNGEKPSYQKDLQDKIDRLLKIVI